MAFSGKLVILIYLLMGLFLDAPAQQKTTTKEVGLSLFQVNYLREYSRYGSHGVAASALNGIFLRLNKPEYALRFMFSYSSITSTPARYLEFKSYYLEGAETSELSILSVGFGVQKTLKGERARHFYTFADLLYVHELWKGTTYVPSMRKISPSSTLCNLGQLFAGLGYNLPVYKRWNFSAEAAPGIVGGLTMLRYTYRYGSIRQGKLAVMTQGVFRFRVAYLLQ